MSESERAKPEASTVSDDHDAAHGGASRVSAPRGRSTEGLTDRVLIEIDNFLVSNLANHHAPGAAGRYNPNQTETERTLARRIRVGQAHASAALGLRRGMDAGATRSQRLPAQDRQRFRDDVRKADRTKAQFDALLDRKRVVPSLATPTAYACGFVLGLLSGLGSDSGRQRLAGSVSHLSVQGLKNDADHLEKVDAETADQLRTLATEHAGHACNRGAGQRSALATRTLRRAGDLLSKVAGRL